APQMLDEVAEDFPVDLAAMAMAVNLDAGRRSPRGPGFQDQRRGRGRGQQASAGNSHARPPLPVSSERGRLCGSDLRTGVAGVNICLTIESRSRLALPARGIFPGIWHDKIVAGQDTR